MSLVGAEISSSTSSSSKKLKKESSCYNGEGTRNDKWGFEFQPVLDVSGAEKCGGVVGMENWESILLGQEESLLRWIMGGDSQDPLKQLMQQGEGCLVANPSNFTNPPFVSPSPYNPSHGLFHHPSHNNFVPLPNYTQQDQDQLVIDQLCKAEELVEMGNLVQAQAILARLNQQLSPFGKPLQRACYLFKEALQLLLTTDIDGAIITPVDVVRRINAYKAFSEVSPLVQFMNCSCNQFLLEELDRYNRIHIIDFDIGFGVQWSSFMQEITTRSSVTLSFKITAVVSQSLHNALELVLIRDNLCQFANELGIPFEFNVVGFDSLDSLSLHVTQNEAVAVNFPFGPYSSYLSSSHLILGVIKKLSPKIVVSVDQECHRSDLPFLQSIQSYSILLDSLDAVNVNPDTQHKIEKFFLEPMIERIVLGRQRCPNKMPSWRSLFASAGFSPSTFSNFSEIQAECVLKRLPVRGFHIEKRHGSLILCWQRRELGSVSAWRC